MNNRILIFGDSIAWGAWDSEGGWAFRLKKYTDSQAVKNNFENYNTVYPLGISGDSTNELINRFETELSSRLSEDSSVVVVIAIGTNDSMFAVSNGKNWVDVDTFEKNLEKILEIANKNNVRQLIFIGAPPVNDSILNPIPWFPSHIYSNESIEKYNNIIKKFANKNNFEFVDLYNDFTKNNYKELLSDGVHPNTEGHKQIYEKILEEFIKLQILE